MFFYAYYVDLQLNVSRLTTCDNTALNSVVLCFYFPIPTKPARIHGTFCESLFGAVRPTHAH